jgi:hypothetical protein
MTQPEETTAALIARLHEENRIAYSELARLTHIGAQEAAERERLKCERDEQRARAENAEARTCEVRKHRNEAVDHWIAKVGQLQSDITAACRERDEAQAKARKVAAELAEHVHNYAGMYDTLGRTIKERDEAREQLGRVQADYQVFMLGTAHGAKCWADECGWHCDEGCKAKYARKCVAAQELKDAREQLAKLEWAGRSGWAKEPACALCWGYMPPDKPSYGQEHYGHRPTCWFAKKEAEKSEERTIDDALIRAAASLAVSYAWRYACGADVGTQDATETARPEPRFKVGEKVVWEESQTSQREGHVESIGNGAYLVRSRSGHLFSWAEDRLKPAPKFAVGEWVEAKGVTGPVIARHWERSRANTWSYDVQTPRWVRLLYEFELTAQTPQHKHDCEGCVFLGRMGKWDLWFSAKGSIFVPGPSVFANGGSDPLGEYRECSAIEPTSPELTEARRRAVARGLVK